MDYVRIGILEAKASIDEVTKLAREGMLPIFRKLQGFVSYDLVPSGDGKTLVSISRWRSREAAEQGDRSAAEFMRGPASKAGSLVSTHIGPAIVSSGAREELRMSTPSQPM